MRRSVSAAARRNRFEWQWMCVVGWAFISVLGFIAVPHIQGANQGDPFPPRAHAAWVYDTVKLPGQPRQSDPGYFAGALNDYNRRAGGAHKIRMVYTYSGSLEMYCPAGRVERCREEDLIVTYTAGKGLLRPSVGTLAARAYRQSLIVDKQEAEPVIVAVLDGVVNADYEGSMRGFDQLSQPLAEAFADKVAREVCSDPLIDGVQFDIEPFNVEDKNGQYFFYHRIAKNFAGDVPTVKGRSGVNCRDDSHPRGRFFSVFAAARHLRADSSRGRNMQSIMTVADNGYVIVPLYDLGSKPLGHATPVEEYRRQVQTQVRQTRRWAKALGVAYQFGIPAAASVHEYAGCEGSACVDGQVKDRSQLAYVKVVLDAIKKSDARRDPLYLGNAVWAWSRGIVHGGARFQPQTPPEDVMAYMAENL